MTQNVSWNGSTYPIPDVGNRQWGQNVTNYLVALAAGALSKAGGNFTLTADVNFGASFGLIAKYLKSNSSNTAQSGVVRFANAESIVWRNAANSADKALKVNASDRLEFDGANVVMPSTTDTLTNKTIDAANNTLSNIADANIKSGAAIDAAKIGSGAVSNTEFGYLDGVTSAIQTQLDAKAPTSSPTFSGNTTFSALTASTVPYLNASKVLTSSAVTPTELGYVSGVTSALQTQLNAKAPSTSPSLASPTVTDYALFTEASAPSTPAAGKVAIYAKSDKKIYKKDSNGTESELGAGGTSAINYISNYDFETGATTGWATYKDAAAATPVDGTGGSPTTLTLSANSSSPMRGSYDFKIAKSAANSQGEGFSYDFTIKVPDKSKKLSISFDLNTTDSNYTAGDVVIYVYDVTNATLITPSTTSLPKMSGTWAITFDSTTSTSYRLIFHYAVTTATAANLYFDNIVVGPGQLVQGPAVTYIGRDTALSTTGFGTPTAIYVDYWRSTNMLIVKGSLTTGTVSGTNATITLRDSLTADLGTTQIIGRWWRNTAGATTRKTGTLFMANGDTTVKFGSDDYTTASNPPTVLTGSSVTANTEQIWFEFSVPVGAWAGNGNLSLGAGAQVEYASNSNNTAATASDTTSFVTGPSGSALFTTSLSGTSGSRRVRFQYPIQNDDVLVLQVSSDRVNWFDIPLGNDGTIGSIEAYRFDGTQYIGAGAFTYVSATDVDVWFGKYRTGTAAWISGGYWRVRKAKASAPVGFGLAGTDGSSGLYKPGQAPGQATGTAIATGYIGEVVTFNQTSSQNFTGSTTQYANLLTLSSSNLSAGVWLLYGVVTLQANGAAGFAANYVSVSDYSGNITTDHAYPTQTQIPTTIDATSSPNYIGMLSGCIVYMTGSNSKYIKARCDFSAGTPQYRYSIRAVRIA